MACEPPQELAANEVNLFCLLQNTNVNINWPKTMRSMTNKTAELGVLEGIAEVSVAPADVGWVGADVRARSEVGDKLE
jgi:hypothetical protein